MSHWTTIKTEFKKKSALLKALQMLYPDNEIVTDAVCRGYYEGQQEKCDVVVEDKTGHHDLGYRVTEDGSYEQIIDWYGVNWTSKSFVDDNLKQRYAAEVLKETADEQGMFYDEVMKLNGEMELTIESY